MTTSVTPIRLTLQNEREKAGLTQAELAERVGVRQATISRLESGVTKQVDLPLLEQICRVLGKVRDKEPSALLRSLFVLEDEPPKQRGKK